MFQEHSTPAPPTTTVTERMVAFFCDWMAAAPDRYRELGGECGYVDMDDPMAGVIQRAKGQREDVG